MQEVDLDDAPWKQALRQFVDELRALYGPRLDRVVLYGSRARGETQEDSDVDLLVVLSPLPDFWAELSRIAPVASRVSLEWDVVLSAIPVDAAEFADPHSPLLISSRREGVLVG